MQIGILTFHRAINAGAVLQAYALQETLSRLGHDVSIIDYRPPYIDKAYKPIRSIDLRHPVGLLYEISSSILRFKRLKKYRNFRNIYLRTKPLSTLSECDCVFLGSDQIWNSSITGGRLDPAFFNQSPLGKAKKGIAYAASTMSIERLTANDLDDFSVWLPRLSAIGAREKKLGEFLSDRYSLPVTEVIDPTLLAPKDIFDPFISKPSCDSDYLLFYEVWHNDEVENKAREVARDKGLKFIGISGSDIRMHRTGIRQIVSPSEFVSYIANASHVVTSSFHGTAFSLIFEKQFNVVCEEPHQAVRMKELLDSIGLNEKLTFRMSGIDNKPIQYDMEREKIAAYRIESMKFIKDSLR